MKVATFVVCLLALLAVASAARTSKMTKIQKLKFNVFAQVENKATGSSSSSDDGSCDSLDQPTDASYSTGYCGDDAPDGTECSYDCDYGICSGDETRTCTDGEWDGEELVCLPEPSEYESYSSPLESASFEKVSEEEGASGPVIVLADFCDSYSEFGGTDTDELFRQVYDYLISYSKVSNTDGATVIATLSEERDGFSLASNNTYANCDSSRSRDWIWDNSDDIRKVEELTYESLRGVDMFWMVQDGTAAVGEDGDSSAHVPTLTDEETKVLENFVRDGGAVMAFWGHNTDASGSDDPGAWARINFGIDLIDDDICYEQGWADPTAAAPEEIDQGIVWEDNCHQTIELLDDTYAQILLAGANIESAIVLPGAMDPDNLDEIYSEYESEYQDEESNRDGSHKDSDGKGSASSGWYYVASDAVEDGQEQSSTSTSGSAASANGSEFANAADSYAGSAEDSDPDEAILTEQNRILQAFLRAAKIRKTEGMILHPARLS